MVYESIGDLNDEELSSKPENCDMSRFCLILGQFRHWHCHMGIIYGFIVADTGKRPYVLNMDGIIYISFKYGDFEGQREGRYFTELTEKSANELLKTVPELKKEKQWITGDVRIDRGNERWINMIFRK